MIQISYDADTKNYVMQMAGESGQVDAELSWLMTAYRRILISSHGKKEGKARYKKIAKGKMKIKRLVFGSSDKGEGAIS